MDVSHAIRTGLLQSIATDALVNLVVSLIGAKGETALAEYYIAEVSQCTRQQLLDSGYWWEDTCYRKDGNRYKHTRHPQTHPADPDDSDPHTLRRKRKKPPDDPLHNPAAVLLMDIEEMTGATEERDTDAHFWDDIQEDATESTRERTA